jgi:hypothetical protein
MLSSLQNRRYYIIRKCVLNWINSLSWLYIRFVMWQPSKHVRRWLLNMYKNINISRGVPINHGCELWIGLLEIG